MELWKVYLSTYWLVVFLIVTISVASYGCPILLAPLFGFVFGSIMVIFTVGGGYCWWQWIRGKKIDMDWF